MASHAASPESRENGRQLSIRFLRVQLLQHAATMVISAAN